MYYCLLFAYFPFTETMLLLNLAVLKVKLNWGNGQGLRDCGIIDCDFFLIMFASFACKMKFFVAVI